MAPDVLLPSTLAHLRAMSAHALEHGNVERAAALTAIADEYEAAITAWHPQGSDQEPARQSALNLA